MGRAPSNMTEKEMQRCLRGFLADKRFLLENLYVFGWESDMLMLSTAGYWTEVEIKVSRSDFLADARKTTTRGYQQMLKHDVLAHGGTGPNYFYYAVPDGMLGPQEVPEHAGLIVVRGVGDYMIIKQAPKLHKEKIAPEGLGLLDKFYYNMQNAKIGQMDAKRREKETVRSYEDVDARIRHEKFQERRRVIWAAEEAFRKSCPEYLGEWVECRLGERCRACERVEKFSELLEKANNL